MKSEFYMKHSALLLIIFSNIYFIYTLNLKKSDAAENMKNLFNNNINKKDQKDLIISEKANCQPNNLNKNSNMKKNSALNEYTLTLDEPSESQMKKNILLQTSPEQINILVDKNVELDTAEKTINSNKMNSRQDISNISSVIARSKTDIVNDDNSNLAINSSNNLNSLTNNHSKINENSKRLTQFNNSSPSSSSSSSSSNSSKSNSSSSSSSSSSGSNSSSSSSSTQSSDQNSKNKPESKIVIDNNKIKVDTFDSNYSDMVNFKKLIIGISIYSQLFLIISTISLLKLYEEYFKSKLIYCDNKYSLFQTLTSENKEEILSRSQSYIFTSGVPEIKVEAFDEIFDFPRNIKYVKVERVVEIFRADERTWKILGKKALKDNTSLCEEEQTKTPDLIENIEEEENPEKYKLEINTLEEIFTFPKIFSKMFLGKVSFLYVTFYNY